MRTVTGIAAVTAALIGAAAGAVSFVDNTPNPPPPTSYRAAAPTSTPTATATATPTSTTGQTTPSPAPTPTWTVTSTQLRRIARSAAGEGGRVQLAVAAPGRRTVAAASSGSTRTWFRLWSVSKAATSIALLRANKWGARRGRPLRADVETSMHSALVRSGDCAQRQLIVELQEQLSGIDNARAAVQDVLRDAGATGARVLERSSVAGTGCRPYLARTRTRDPYRVALQLGTSEWAINDAAQFALALGDGTFEPSITRRMLRLLGKPKLHSDDPFANGLDVTGPLNWGAGSAMRAYRPAYKSGWGGSSGETPTFVNEQVIHLQTSAGPIGVAVTFEPDTVPVRDDPGLTRAPDALDHALRELARMLPRP
ncbi:hypothetical protein OJ998_33010 [Solirubrobacter taibaiensis]|nr:hypothetical protein [Solirubrobacter taibaiensis]